MNEHQGDDCDSDSFDTSSNGNIGTNTFLLASLSDSDARTLSALQQTSQQLDGILHDLNKEISRESLVLANDEDDIDTSDDEAHGEKKLRAELDATILPPWNKYLGDEQSEQKLSFTRTLTSSKDNSLPSKYRACTPTDDLEQALPQIESTSLSTISTSLDGNGSIDNHQNITNSWESGHISVDPAGSGSLPEESIPQLNDVVDILAPTVGEGYVVNCDQPTKSHTSKQRRTKVYVIKICCTLSLLLIVIGVLVALLFNSTELAPRTIVTGAIQDVSTNQPTFAPTAIDSFETELHEITPEPTAMFEDIQSEATSEDTSPTPSPSRKQTSTYSTGKGFEPKKAVERRW